MVDVAPLTASEAAARGLAIVAHLGLEADPVTALAESIVAGDVDDDALAKAIADWPVRADQNPKLAGLAWLLTGGSSTRAHAKTRARVAGTKDHSTGVMIALVPDDPTAVTSIAADGLPVEEIHLTLTFHGSLDDEDEPPPTFDELADVAAAIADASTPIVADATHVAHLGPDRDALVLEVPDMAIHQLQRDLVDALGDIWFSDRYAFRPHSTVGYYDEQPIEEGPLDEPIPITFSTLILQYGEQALSFDLSAADQPQVATPGSTLANVLEQLSEDMNRIQRVARASVQSTMDLATRSAADRIGRLATQKVTNADVKTRCRLAPPRLAVARMGRVVFAALDLDEQQRVKEALGEGLDVVEQTLTDRSNEVLATFSRQFAVDHDPNPYTPAIVAALDYLRTAATDWVIEKLHDPDATAPDRFPSDIVLTTLQIAGGNEVPATNLPARAGGLQPSLTFGPTFKLLLADTLTAYREPDEPAPATAAARRQPGANISIELIEELTTVAEILDGDDLPLEPVRRWIHSGSDTPFEAHADLDGTVFETEEEYQFEAGWSSSDFPYVDVLAPGDHSGCGCELEVVARLDLVALQRRRDLAA